MRTVHLSRYVKSFDDWRNDEREPELRPTCEMSLHHAAFSCSVDATKVIVTGGPLRQSIVMRKSRPLYSAAAAAAGRAGVSAVVVSKLLVVAAEVWLVRLKLLSYEHAAHKQPRRKTRRPLYTCRSQLTWEWQVISSSNMCLTLPE